jgi:hypothetical protein
LNPGLHPRSLSENILREAYENAKSIFTEELTEDENKKTFVRENSGLEDVLQTLAVAKAKYDAKQTSKARKWLGIFSSKVMFYASVLDVLVQHHPEYVSLVWGAMRLLFAVCRPFLVQVMEPTSLIYLQGVINQEETMRELSKSFSQIADILPRTDLSLVLYPTDLMKETIAKLYAYIIKFVIHAVRWYKQGKLAHAWAAVAKPWALCFKTHFEDIAEQAQQIEALARSASRAELRDTHLEIREIRNELRRLIQLGLANQTLHAQIQVGLSESKTMIANIQLGQILDMSFAASLPASGECLGFCQSMVRRRRLKTQLLLPNTAQLQRWSDYPRSSFLITESSSGQAAKDFLVHLVDLIRASDRRVLWALRFANYWERKLTTADILRILVIQALQINPKALTSNLYPISVTHLREAVDERDWLVLLNRAIAGLPFVYIVLDADLLGHATGQDRYLATKLIEAFPRIMNSTVVKVVISTAGVDERYAANNWDPECWSKLRTDHVNGRQSTMRRRRGPKDRTQNRRNVPRSWSG